MKTIYYFLAGIGLVTALSGCYTPGIYRGCVIEKQTRKPVVDCWISGHYEVNKKFGLSMDGFFVRKSCGTDVRTDSDGRFQINLGGFQRSINVISAVIRDSRGFPTRPRRITIYLDKWPQEKELIIELVPEEDASKEGDPK